MPGPMKGSRNVGNRECRVCAHPGKEEINAMILNGTEYQAIISRMVTVHSGEEELTKASLSRHKTNHLLNQPITVTSDDGTKETTYITGVIRSEALTIPPEQVPVLGQITLEQALWTVATAGILNILNNPGTVSPRTTIEALGLLKDLKEGAPEKEGWEDAWNELGAKKSELKQKAKGKRTKRTVTVEETVTEVSVEQSAAPESSVPEPVVIDGIIISDESTKQLPKVEYDWEG